MTLLSQLEAAPEGSRELSDGVLKACGWIPGGRESWKAPSGKWYWPHGDQCPDPSQNLQDAVSLVPEGWLLDQMGEWAHPKVRERGPWYAILVTAERKMLARCDNAPAPCLALCIAIIKAHESSKAEAA